MRDQSNLISDWLIYWFYIIYCNLHSATLHFISVIYFDFWLFHMQNGSSIARFKWRIAMLVRESANIHARRPTDMQSLYMQTPKTERDMWLVKSETP